MFYCDKCHKLTQHNEPMTKLVTEKYENGNIKKEINICTTCAGVTWPPIPYAEIAQTINEQAKNTRAYTPVIVVRATTNKHDRVQAI
jgi:uncharacterized protein with PIN domain